MLGADLTAIYKIQGWGMGRVTSQKALIAALSGVGLLCGSAPLFAADTTFRNDEAGSTPELTARNAIVASSQGGMNDRERQSTESAALPDIRQLLQLVAAQAIQLAEQQRQIDETHRQLEDLQKKMGVLLVGPTRTVKVAAAGSQTSVGSEQPQPSAAPSGPGSFSVDEDAAQRALERNLTQTGALLLPAGQIDLEPNLTYSRRETSSPEYYLVGSTLVLASQQQKRDEVTGNLALKVGLPWDSQLEFSLPYSFVRQSQLTDLGSAGSFTGSDNASGLGDPSVGVAKTLTRERGWRPDIIGRLTYTVGSGKQSDNGVPLPGGNPAAQVQLVAVKRQDPLAFVGSLSYQKSFEKDHIKQGDQIGFSLGASLASSPQTSLQFSFSQTFAQKAEINGNTVPGTERTVGLFNVGASSILSKNVMFNTVLSIGLSDDAPKYAIQFSLPIRFSF